MREKKTALCCVGSLDCALPFVSAGCFLAQLRFCESKENMAEHWIKNRIFDRKHVSQIGEPASSAEGVNALQEKLAILDDAIERQYLQHRFEAAVVVEPVGEFDQRVIVAAAATHRLPHRGDVPHLSGYF